MSTVIRSPGPPTSWAWNSDKHGLAAEAEARIAARARRLHQLDGGLQPRAAGRRRRTRGAPDMLGP